MNVIRYDERHGNRKQRTKRKEVEGFLSQERWPCRLSYTSKSLARTIPSVTRIPSTSCKHQYHKDDDNSCELRLKVEFLSQQRWHLQCLKYSNRHLLSAIGSPTLISICHATPANFAYVNVLLMADISFLSLFYAWFRYIMTRDETKVHACKISINHRKLLLLKSHY